MGFMGEIAEESSWNNCIDYIIDHLDSFQESQLDVEECYYFPSDKLIRWLNAIKTHSH